LRSQTRNRCGGQRPFLLRAPKSNEQDGEEAATPGQPVRACARFWNIPRQFTLENYRLPLALPQSFGELRNSHVFAEPTLSQIVAPRNTKNFHACAEPVDDVSSLWKTEEN